MKNESEPKFLHQAAGFDRMTLYEALCYGAAINRRAPAFLYKGKRLNFADFMQMVERTADALLRAGVKAGDVISTALPNLPKHAAVLYAANKIGAVAYLNHALEPAEPLEKYLRAAESKILFALDSSVVMYAPFCKANGIRLISCCPADELGFFIRALYRRREGLTREKRGLAEDFNAFIKSMTASIPTGNIATGPSAIPNSSFLIPNSFSPPPSPFSTAVLLNSGGTMGKAKTIELSSFAINALSSDGPRLIETDRLSSRYMMSPLPIFHSFGLTMGLHAMAMHGGCNVFMPKFSRRDTLRYLKKGQINYMVGVPAVYEALNTCADFSGARLRGVDIAFVGGDVFRPATKAEFDRRMSKAGSRGRLMQGYGLSETMSVACVNIHEENRDGSVGRPIRGVRICVGADGNPSVSVGCGCPSIASQAVLQKYDSGSLSPSKHDRLALSTDDKDIQLLSNQPSSIKNLPPSARCGELLITGTTLMNGYFRDAAATEAVFITDADGIRWLKTGDYGAVDADGYVYFLERLKRIVKVSGESVFPEEIESAVAAVRGVAAVAAFGIPDERMGSCMALAVEVTAGIDRERLRAQVSDALMRSVQEKARPKAIEFFDELPRTKMMKIDIAALTEKLSKHNRNACPGRAAPRSIDKKNRRKR
ncbi:MAG: acyl--CoA ligase [Firmicutes bacterium]|nr:acyl--CoA ligase [Bacillota bacterium]